MKPFRAYLAEQEQDYEYKLCSVVNIHDAEVMEMTRYALGRYGLISLEKHGVQTQIKDTDAKKFDAYPFMPVYICKVVLSSPVSSNMVVQSVSLLTRIPDEKLKLFDMSDEIVMDGADAEQHAHPVEVDGKGAQSEVGDEHAKNLVSDLMKELQAKRDAETIEREVYEGWTASHHEVSKMLGQKVRRGFYLIENEGDGAGTVCGPFRSCPDNYEYVGTLPTVELKESVEQNGLVEYQVSFADAEMQQDPTDAGSRSEGERVEVELVNQDTGKTHKVVVRATSSNSARAKAVEIIAQRTGLSKEKFMPTSPDSTPGN